MEYFVKVGIVKGTEGRLLLCDLCGDVLVKEEEDNKPSIFYAWVYEDKKQRYLEKYLCPKCRKKIKRVKEIDIEKVDLKLARAIYGDVTSNVYGFMMMF